MVDFDTLFLDEFDGNGKYRIMHIVADDILGKDIYPLIEQRYFDLKRNFNQYTEKYILKHHLSESLKWQFSPNLKPFKDYTDTTSVPIAITHPFYSTLRDRYIESIDVDKAAVGFDMPSWFGLGKATNRIMFVAQDPLRNPYWYDDTSNAICSTPFGLHSADWRENGRGGKRVMLLCEKLIGNGCGVYFTDIMKFYICAQKDGKKYKPFRADKDILKRYSNILQKEIEVIQPKAIVALGKEADKALRKMKMDIDIISMPHFSGSAQGTFKDFFSAEIADLGYVGKLNAEQQSELFASHIMKKIKFCD